MNKVYKNRQKNARVIFVNLNIILYTGFTLEELYENPEFSKNIEVLQRFLDFIIDGRYDHSLRDLTLAFRGSKNQRVIDLKNTLKEEKIIIFID